MRSPRSTRPAPSSPAAKTSWRPSTGRCPRTRRCARRKPGRKRRQELRDSRTEAERVCAVRQEELEAAQTAADEFAADTRLPVDPEELAAVRAGLGDYRVALAA